MCVFTSAYHWEKSHLHFDLSRLALRRRRSDSSPTEMTSTNGGSFRRLADYPVPLTVQSEPCPIIPSDMPPKSQKKLCSRKNCSGDNCPFPHATQTVKFKHEPLPPKTRYHGASPLQKAEKILTVIPPSEVLVKPSCHAVPAPSRDPMCRGCRRPFTLSVAEKEWFISKAMRLPK